MIETHPLSPFLPPNAKVLMLGSFPPPQNRWKMNFYYPNFNNDMWRILGIVFFNDAHHFIETHKKQFCEQTIRDFLQEQGIAIYDTAFRINRLQGNASDKFLQIIETTDIAKLLSSLPLCQNIITTGELATQTLLAQIFQPVNTPNIKIGQPLTIHFAQRQLTLCRLPSTSRAYPLALTQKAESYRQFFNTIFQAA